VSPPIEGRSRKADCTSNLNFSLRYDLQKTAVLRSLDFRDAHDKVDCREVPRKRHDDN
jgi:hypothetical protein